MVQRLLVFLLLLGFSLGPVVGTGHTAQAAPLRRPGGDEKTLLVYPNPSTGIVHLTINGMTGRRAEVQVLNVIGTVVYRETLTELNDRFTKTLDLSRFANGLYYVKLQSDNTSQICKLVIR